MGRPYVTLALILYAASLSSPTAGADYGAAAEYRVKTAFLYNFAQFIEWPQQEGNSFRLCIVGDNPFGELLETLTGKTVQGSVLAVEEHRGTEGIRNCQLAFISHSLSENLHEVLSILHGQPTLTVSDIDGFIDQGGMIGLLLIDNRVRFEINANKAVSAGLSISSKLLSLATTVKTGQAQR